MTKMFRNGKYMAPVSRDVVHGLALFNPFVISILMVAISLLSILENPLGWHLGKEDYVVEFTALSMLAAILFWVGAKVGLNTKVEVGGEFLCLPRLRIIFLIALFFVFAKVAKMGVIPIFSDNPYAKQLGGDLGGFVDFTLRLTFVSSIMFFMVYLADKRKLFLVLSVFALFVALLMSYRGYAILIILGWVTTYLALNKVPFRKLVAVALLTGLAGATVVATVQMYRHGLAGIYNWSDLNVFEVSFWVIHGDLTGATKSGAHILSMLGPGGLSGNYNIGYYLSVVGASDLHGAEYIRHYFFSDANSAQSIGAPFSYILDFGFWGMSLSFVSGYLYGVFLEGAKNKSLFFTLLFSLFLFSVLWSLRSGLFPLSPFFIFSSMFICFIVEVKFKNGFLSLIKRILSAGFVVSLPLSFLFLVARF